MNLNLQGELFSFGIVHRDCFLGNMYREDIDKKFKEGGGQFLGYLMLKKFILQLSSEYFICDEHGLYGFEKCIFAFRTDLPFRESEIEEFRSWLIRKIQTQDDILPSLKDQIFKCYLKGKILFLMDSPLIYEPDGDCFLFESILKGMNIIKEYDSKTVMVEKSLNYIASYKDYEPMNLSKVYFHYIKNGLIKKENIEFTKLNRLIGDVFYFEYYVLLLLKGLVVDNGQISIEERTLIIQAVQSGEIDSLLSDNLNLLKELKKYFSNVSIPEKSVCITGFIKTSFGLGEDSRTFLQALESFEDRVKVRSFNQTTTHRNDRSITYDSVESFWGGIEIFTMPLKASRDRIKGDDFFSGRKGVYRVVFAPWEFDEWREDLSYLFNFFDEVWAPTTFVLEAYRKFNCNAHLMWPAVTIGEVANKPRHYFGLPSEGFIFLFCFDALSHLERKNPKAIIEAFAIANLHKNTYLVFKVMNIDDRCEEKLRSLIKQKNLEGRVIIISDYLSYEDNLSLFNLSNCYISLHRSEGFGRTIAEAMLLEKPVITTNYSGNIDFCNEETAFLVDSDLTLVKKEDYPNAKGFFWAEPKIKSASLQMEIVLKNTEKRDKIARQGRDFIEKNFSTDALSKRLKKRLSKIG